MEWVKVALTELDAELLQQHLVCAQADAEYEAAKARMQDADATRDELETARLALAALLHLSPREEVPL
jgi:hypothetical protein